MGLQNLLQKIIYYYITTQAYLLQCLLFYKVNLFAVVLLLRCCWEGASALFCVYCVCSVLCVRLYVLLLLCSSSSLSSSSSTANLTSPVCAARPQLRAFACPVFPAGPQPRPSGQCCLDLNLESECREERQKICQKECPKE